MEFAAESSCEGEGVKDSPGYQESGTSETSNLCTSCYIDMYYYHYRLMHIIEANNTAIYRVHIIASFPDPTPVFVYENWGWGLRTRLHKSHVFIDKSAKLVL